MVEVFVGGLPYSTTSEELCDAARRSVPDATARLVIDRETGRSKGFGFIAVPDVVSAQQLIDAYHNQDFGGRLLTVNVARPMSSRPSRYAAILEPIAELTTPDQVILIGQQVSASLIEFFAEHPEEMRLMPHRRFEELMAEVWQRFGYEVELTKRTRDGGIDIIAIRDAEISTRFLIECKRLAPHNKVSVEPVRALYGVKTHLGASKAILATTVYFTSEARQFIDRHPWELEGKDYDGVVSWLKQAARESKQTAQQRYAPDRE